MALVAVFVAFSTHSAVLVYSEDFESGASGWAGRDGIMSVSHQFGVGSPPSGAMQSSFDSQAFPTSQTDAFRINSGPNFVGDYTSFGAQGITRISFDLFAVNVLPSDLMLRILSGADTFFYQFSLGSMPLNTWTEFSVFLNYGHGWVGPSEAAFDSALTSVDQLDVQLSRSGTSAQTFYLDNVTTWTGDIPEPPVIPEANTALLLLFGLALLRRVRNTYLAGMRSIEAA